MSSPKITRMFGRCCCCALAGLDPSSAAYANPMAAAPERMPERSRPAVEDVVSIARDARPRAIDAIKVLRSPRRLPSHHVLDQADDEREDCTGHAAAHGLPEQGADIDTSGPTREHRNERLQDRAAGDTADRARD